MNKLTPPTKAEIERNLQAISPYVIETPSLAWPGSRLSAELAPGTKVFAKLEALQKSGSFKARGAITNILSLDEAAKRRGVTGISAGNHAIAVAYAAEVAGVSAKVVMAKSALPMRIDLCRRFGAEVVLAGDITEAFETVARIEREEGRSFIQPFEGEKTILGTATVGLEFASQIPDLEAVIISVGGGGLIAGAAAGIKALLPDCLVLGVEPEAADGMTRSLAAGRPLEDVPHASIADSLGPPLHMPYSFALVQQLVDGLVTVSDDDLRRAMELIFYDLKMAVEPAGAAAVAALRGPLKERLAGKKVGLLICGANIDPQSFHEHLAAIAD